MGTSHFKTQQEIWKYVANGGAVINVDGSIVKFINGQITYEFLCPVAWSPYIEPVPKTKVWRWEKTEAGSRGNRYRYLAQTDYLFSEEQASADYPGYTKVPGSEREI